MPSKKKKARSKKSVGHQVARPSHKKPRPQKYVEPKIPTAKPIGDKVAVKEEPYITWAGMDAALNEALADQDIVAALKALANTPSAIGAMVARDINDGVPNDTVAKLDAAIDELDKALKGGGHTIKLGLGRDGQTFTEEEITNKIKTGGMAPRPKLGTLRDTYEEYRKGGVKGPNPPIPVMPGEVIQLELPRGHTEKSVAGIVNKVAAKLYGEHKQKIGEIAVMFGEEYKTKGFEKLTTEDKNKSKAPSSDNFSSTPNRLTWRNPFKVIRRWFSE